MSNFFICSYLYLQAIQRAIRPFAFQATPELLYNSTITRVPSIATQNALLIERFLLNLDFT